MARTRTTFKHSLVNSTALIGTAVAFSMALSAVAQAATTINTSTTTPVILNAGNLTLTVTDTGSLTTTATPAVTVNGAATSIAVQADTVTPLIGQISTGSGQPAILVTGVGSDLTSGITVDGVLQADGNVIQVAAGAHISGNIVNNNYITPITSGNAAAVLVTGAGSNISGQFINNANHGIKSSTNAAFDIENGGNMSGGIYLNTNSHVSGGNATTGAAIVVNGAGSDISGGIHSTKGVVEGLNSAIAVTAGGKISGGIHNTGLIVSTSSHTNALIKVDGLNSDITGGGINNSGTIAGNLIGVGVTNNGNISGGIDNSGTIVGNNIGISVSNANISGGITNHGTLVGTNYAILVVNSSTVQGVSNNGTISGTRGIYLGTGGNIASLLNDTGGKISGSNNAVQVISSSSITGSITNRGVITSSSQAGVDVTNSGKINGNIDNFGTISGANKAINLTGGGTIGGSIINETGGIIVTSGNTFAVSLDNSTLNGSFVNAAGGTISAQQSNLYLHQATVGGVIDNSGTLKSTGSTNLAIRKSTVHDITNEAAGRMQAPSDNIFIASTSNVSGSITNSGVLTSSNTSIYVTRSAINGAINNNAGGTISGAVQGIVFDVGSSITGQILNSGKIVSTGGKAITAKNGASIFNINNAGGTISGQTAISFSTNPSIAGSILNTGLIKGSTTGIMVGALTSPATLITNNAGGTISGGAGGAIHINDAAHSHGILINGGSIVGNVTDDNATTANSSPVEIAGTFTTGGNFTVSDFTADTGKSLTVTAGNAITAHHALALNGATVNIGVASAASFGSFVTDNAANITGTTFTVVSAASPTLSNGATLKIISGGAPLVGGPGGVTPATITDNSALWNFAIVDGSYHALSSADDLYLVVSSAPTTSCSSTPNTAGNSSACTVLQANTSTTDPKLQQLIANMNAASTTQQLNNVLSSVQAGVNGAGVQQSIDVANSALDLNGQRMALLSGGAAGMASGNSVADKLKGKNGWVQSFGQFSHQGTRGNIGGYDAHTLGLAVGLDSGTNLDGKIIGFAFSYAHTGADSKNANTTDTDIDSYQLSAYGNYSLPQNSYLQGMAALTWNNTDTARHDVGGVAGLTANGSFGAKQFTLRGEAGRDYAYEDAVITPKLTGRWTFYSADSYTETGAGGANLHVNYKNMNIFEVGPAVSARWKHKYADGSLLVPQLSLGYSYDLVGDDIEASSAFTGGTGTIASVGPTPARGRLTFDAQATLYTASNWNLTADYDLNYKADYVSHAGFLRAGYKF